VTYNVDFKFDYAIKHFYEDTTDQDNLRYTKFYDSADQLICVSGPEGCTRYFYNDKGKLKETIWGRNCSGRTREIMIYDQSDNLLGTYRTRDSVVNLDTIKFDQKKFYDTENRLIKELEREGNFSNGEHFEIWNYYFYKDKRISEVIVKQNLELLWNCKYIYDDKGRLKEKRNVRGTVTDSETYTYDQSDRLLEKKIKNNEYPLTPETSFSARNNKTLYKYNSLGQLVEQITLNHKDIVHARWFETRMSGN
jgi:YD repeat-containing protein